MLGQTHSLRSRFFLVGIMLIACSSLIHSDLTCRAQDNTAETTVVSEETAESNPPHNSSDDSDSRRFQDIETLNEMIQPSIVTIRIKGRDGDELAIGTGFVISADGQVVTNAHVIGEGRAISVELPSGRLLPVLAIEASDQLLDLAVLRVDVGEESLVPLKLSTKACTPGMRVAAFGNPLGLRNSVVAGVVSAVREVQGRELIQLAMPTQPGNSGGPLVDLSGNVCGIVNMKSAIDDNLGFAIPVDQLTPILNDLHPVPYDRWVTLGRLDPNQWNILFGSTWQQVGALITARGAGSGFGGRSICLNQNKLPKLPIEIAVDVRLDDESGAAGLAFYSDGDQKHYGFYPSNGNLRLTCFKGPSVYSWEVLGEFTSKKYRNGDWNRLRVRLENHRFLCFVNDELVVESTDQQIKGGAVGLVKFRDTQPDFRRFEVGVDLARPSLTPEQKALLASVIDQTNAIDDQDQETILALAKSSEAVSRDLTTQASLLELKVTQLKRLASDIKLQHTLNELQATVSEKPKNKDRLLRGALLIAKIDNEDVDPEAYIQRVNAMATEILESIDTDFDPKQKRAKLDQYLFQENGYHGGRSEYYHPANSHLDRVIDEREGLPITLSILYLEIAKRIGLRVEGIGLPGHFIVQQQIDDTETQFIDVFDRGSDLSQEDLSNIVRDFANRQIIDSDLRAQTDSEILNRVLNNLLGSARRDSDTEAYRRYCEALVAITPDDPQVRIMRSQARAVTKRYSAAIEDVNWLIERIPEGVNREQALRLRDSLIAEQQQDG